MELKVGEQLVVLDHYPMRSWNKSHYGSWQLYGHHHGTLPEDPNAFQMDVGVDCFRYPLSFNQVKTYMDIKARRIGWVKPDRKALDRIFGTEAP